ncbi:ABC transporter permease [Phocaeicola oris]|uniref:ABC transporter permease n=1 Tax=Phocaeicola oris TaxID=2896850 RepID=UPI00234EEC98|nr:ABC transporter permease [Phocaeicola oris]MCE2615809.1 ABC transporter permease [Phocaeicola oris]
MIIKYLLRKEILQIKRNPFLLRLIFMYPIIIMCVMPWVANMEVKNVVVDIVDNDHSTTSSQLIHRIEASNYFIFNGQKSSYNEALKDIEKSNADLVLVIPKDYEKNIVNGKKPQVLIAANAVNGTKGAMGTAYITQIVTANTNSDLSSLTSKMSVFYLHNRSLNYKLYMIPALMALLVMMLCGFLPALNIVSEKEVGTIEQINVTPVKKWTFILAKLTPYWMIGIIVMMVCFLLAWAIYGITSQGNLLYVVFTTLLMSLFFSSVGLIISNYSHTMQQAIFVMWFLVVCMILLSGLFTPVRSMPQWAQRINFFNPMVYYVNSLRTIFIRGGAFVSIIREVCVLSAFVLVTGSWAVLSYKKNS